MSGAEPEFISVGQGADCRRIACLFDAGRGPGLLWLPGFKSEMTSLKATALADWARNRGTALTRLDYSGHGQSPGRFEDGTIGRWLDEVVAVFTGHTRGPQIVVGSSMGGYLALLLLRQLMTASPADAARIHALVLIAPAWDMTERLMPARLTDEARRDLAERGVYLRPSRYGDGPYPITQRLLDEGRQHVIGGTGFDPGRPLHVLHGAEDPDVPLAHSLALKDDLAGDWVRLTVVPDCDHRLSRPQDLELLLATIEGAARQ